MALKLIYATSSDGAFGYKGKLPWPKIGADLQRFRNATLGHACIMGRKTFEGVHALDSRMMLVVSSQYKELQRQFKTRATFVPNFDTARKMAADAFVIGGAEIILSAIPFVNDVWFTFIIGEYEFDVALPFAQELFALPEFDCWEESQVDLRCRFFRFRRKVN